MHAKTIGFLFVKSLGLPSGLLTVQYEWQDDTRLSEFAVVSETFMKEILPMMGNATAYVE